MSGEKSIRIVRAPPPGPETGYELVYKFEVEGRKRWRMNPNPPGEKMSLVEILKTPGLNIIIASIVGGLAVLGYVLYLYFSMR